MNLIKRYFRLPAKLIFRLWNFGPSDAYWWLHNHWETRRRERRWGVSTQAVIQPEELGYSPTATGYDPISYANMDAILDQLEIKSDRDVFVDIGSGLGRAVFAAATRPFRKVIGIELNDNLYRESLKQLEAARPHLTCRDIQIVAADATTFEYPQDATVYFIWNSFLGEILDRVVERLRQNQLANPRPVTLIYAIPFDDIDTLQGRPWLKDRREIPAKFWTGIRTIRYTIYA